MTRTWRPDWASAAATLTVVVVLPTPPFWLATVRTRGETGLGNGRPVSWMRRRVLSASSRAKGVSVPGVGMAAASASRSARSSFSCVPVTVVIHRLVPSPRCDDFPFKGGCCRDFVHRVVHSGGLRGLIVWDRVVRRSLERDHITLRVASGHGISRGRLVRFT